MQRDPLQAAGCERIYEDKAGGANADRPGLKEALAQFRKGDTLVVWRLDRLGRSLRDLILRAEVLNAQGVGLRSLQENIDTDSASGQLIFQIFGALAEFERTLFRERTHAGLSAARARGRKGGRKKLLDAKQCAHAVELYKTHKHTAKEVCAIMGISRATLYTYIEEFSDGP